MGFCSLIVGVMDAPATNGASAIAETNARRIFCMTGPGRDRDRLHDTILANSRMRFLRSTRQRGFMRDDVRTTLHSIRRASKRVPVPTAANATIAYAPWPAGPPISPQTY